MVLSQEFWQTISFSSKDVESLYNHLLEIETPLSIHELTSFLVSKKIAEEKTRVLQSIKSEGKQYLPKDQYKSGQILVFPQRAFEKGKVTAVRPGTNPEYPSLEVISVEFASSDKVDFASNLPEHKLNDFNPIDESDNNLNAAWVTEHYGKSIAKSLQSMLDQNEDLINIAGNYFPQALLVDVGVGHLNLAEAVLEMSDGGPMTTEEMIQQIELPTDVNSKLTEFSLNYALQEDPRFDEVGPSGETLWFLNRLEPDEVQHTPITLQYAEPLVELPADLQPYLDFGASFCDELEVDNPCEAAEEVTVSLTYPHWRSGTLPLTGKLKSLFPTAFETPRVKFTFRDASSSQTFNGWVVRPSKYIFGLREWYEKEGFIPGSLIHVTKGANPGEVLIRADKKHSTKEWIRTFLVGADGGFVFAMLKQSVACSYDERMVTFIPDVKAVDGIWDKYVKTKPGIEKITIIMMRELAKLNPQGHVHAQELYAAVNLVKRCPPGPILDLLFSRAWALHLGDLYFRLEESKIEGA
ncbi:MAG: hypothetical protein VB013_02065 [Anaerolineaceae bacterium]|nr:hypothetical protein [Anaerolineaceae bacterium]